MRLGLLAIGVMIVLCSRAQNSPFTFLPILPPDSTGHYRLLIGGHFHGASTNTSGFPAATVLANINAMNATGANVFLSTGDLFLEPDRDSLRYLDSFFSKLHLALFNAPGNHDLEGHAYHAAARMPVTLSMGADRIVLLDTERDDSRILGDQLEVLEQLAARTGGDQMKHVFIVSHRPIWAEEEPRYSKLFEGNTRSILGANYEKEVLPIIRRLARSTKVFWISGSMAGRAPASMFFQPHEPNITYIQCAVRDQLRDAVLVADVDPGGIRWSAMSLTGQEMAPVETYDAQWWSEHQGKGEEFHWRRIPYLIRKNLGYPAFWYGFGMAFILLIGSWRVVLLMRSGSAK